MSSTQQQRNPTTTYGSPVIRQVGQEAGPTLPVSGTPAGKVSGYVNPMPYFNRPTSLPRTGGNVDVPRPAWQTLVDQQNRGSDGY